MYAINEKTTAFKRSFFGCILSVIFFKEVVWRAVQNIAKGFEVFKFDTVRLVVYQLVEVLIAQSKLYIQPVFRFSLFCQNIQHA